MHYTTNESLKPKYVSLGFTVWGLGFRVQGFVRCSHRQVRSGGEAGYPQSESAPLLYSIASQLASQQQQQHQRLPFPYSQGRSYTASQLGSQLTSWEAAIMGVEKSRMTQGIAAQLSRQLASQPSGQLASQLAVCEQNVECTFRCI